MPTGGNELLLQAHDVGVRVSDVLNTRWGERWLMRHVALLVPIVAALALPYVAAGPRRWLFGLALVPAVETQSRQFAEAVPTLLEEALALANRLQSFFGLGTQIGLNPESFSQLGREVRGRLGSGFGVLRCGHSTGTGFDAP